MKDMTQFITLEFWNILRIFKKQFQNIKKHGCLFLGMPGKDYWMTGKNRPDFEYVIDLSKKRI